MCVISHVQKRTQGLTPKGCVLQHISFGAPSDVMVVLGMRQSIEVSLLHCNYLDYMGVCIRHQVQNITTVSKNA